MSVSGDSVVAGEGRRDGNVGADAKKRARGGPALRYLGDGAGGLSAGAYRFPFVGAGGGGAVTKVPEDAEGGVGEEVDLCAVDGADGQGGDEVGEGALGEEERVDAAVGRRSYVTVFGERGEAAAGVVNAERRPVHKRLRAAGGVGDERVGGGRGACLAGVEGGVGATDAVLDGGGRAGDGATGRRVGDTDEEGDAGHGGFLVSRAGRTRWRLRAHGARPG